MRHDGELETRSANGPSAPVTLGEDSGVSDTALPTVSVVMPVRNEAKWIGRALGSVFAQDYPAHLLEILISDGGSDDGTLTVVDQIVAQHPEYEVHILRCPARTPGAALNLMIRAATGAIIVRVDGHVEIAPDYVTRCVAALRETDASNVGGCISVSSEGFISEGIALALGSFWGNGGALFRGRVSAPMPVDTVPFGAWRRGLFAVLGGFEEDLRAAEDCEFNNRILDSGGRIVLDPAIRSTYFPRRSLGALARQYFRYGRLKCGVVARHPGRLRVRQVAPSALVGAFMLLGTAALLRGNAWIVLPAVVAYLGGVVAASLWVAASKRRLTHFVALPAVLVTLHLSYGLGTLVGGAQMLVGGAANTLWRTLTADRSAGRGERRHTRLRMTARQR
jgi:glycosyltransferase involved in cell wall biosynthesis